LYLLLVLSPHSFIEHFQTGKAPRHPSSMQSVKYNPYASLYEDLEHRRKHSDSYPFGQAYDFSRTHHTEHRLINDVCSILETGEVFDHQRSRRDWETAVAAVLETDALALPPAISVRDLNLELWLGIRARLHESSLYSEQERLVNAAWQIIHPLVQEVCAFSLVDGMELSQALDKVASVLSRVDHAYSLCPNIAFFEAILDPSLKETFTKRCETLHTWAHVTTAIRCLKLEHDYLWSSQEEDSDTSQGYARIRGSIQRFITAINDLLRTARASYTLFSKHLVEMNLPDSWDYMIFTLVSSSCRNFCVFMQRMFMDNFEHGVNTGSLTVHTLERVVDMVKLACTLRRSYAEVANLDNYQHPLSHPSIDVGQLDAMVKAGIKKILLAAGQGLTVGFAGGKDSRMTNLIWTLCSEVAISIPNGSTIATREAWYAVPDLTLV
jgi:uncharacterized protein YjaG (DUF416 family)